MPRLTAFEFQAYLQGFPKPSEELPVLGEARAAAVLTALSKDLGGDKLKPKARRRLLHRIAGAQLAYNRLTNDEQLVPLIWTIRHENELKRTAEAAQQLSSRLKQCSFPARTRFGHSGIDGAGYRKLRSLVDQILAITDGAYRLKPDKAPSRRGDVPFNVLVGLLAMAWEQATEMHLTRSTKQTKTPLPFIQEVLKEIGVK
jgi:hypothetical protein